MIYALGGFTAYAIHSNDTYVWLPNLDYDEYICTYEIFLCLLMWFHLHRSLVQFWKHFKVPHIKQFVFLIGLRKG